MPSAHRRADIARGWGQRVGPRKGSGFAPEHTGGHQEALDPTALSKSSSLSTSGQSEHCSPHPYSENAMSSQAHLLIRTVFHQELLRGSQGSSTSGPESTVWGCQGGPGWAATRPHKGPDRAESSSDSAFHHHSPCLKDLTSMVE